MDLPLKEMSQSLPNQVNDFNDIDPRVIAFACQYVAIPSKPGQRLQLIAGYPVTDIKTTRVAIPSKPGQRLQCPPIFSMGGIGGIVAIPSKPGQRLQ